MKTKVHLLPAILIGLFGTCASAQDPGPTGSGSTNRQVRQTIDVDFNGGTLADLVNVLRGAANGVNILIPPEAAEVSVPNLALRTVSVEAALRAVADVVTDQRANVGIGVVRVGGGQPVFTVRVLLARPAADEPGSEETFVRVYSIRSMTEHNPRDNEGDPITMSAETILTAIDTGLEVASGQTEKAQIRYHEDSGLLFVRGTWAQNNLIESILENMNRDMAARRAANRRG